MVWALQGRIAPTSGPDRHRVYSCRMSNVDRQHVLQLYAYHHWATDRVLDALAVASREELDRKWGGSFGTGRALLRHVVGVERLWLERWKGTSLKQLPDFAATHSGREFRAEWETVKGDQQRFLAALTNGQLASDLAYVNTKGERWTYPLAEVLVHVVNHGTYHRGQLTHLLRDLGQPAPSTDYLIFVDEKRRGEGG
jgi:uncharacterized damage-inducible protein DinB